MSHLLSRIFPNPTASLGLIALLVASQPGCSMNTDEPTGSRDSVEEDTSDSDPYDASTAADSSDVSIEPTGEFVPFDQLVPQTVPWFDVDVSIESAESRTRVVETLLGGYEENSHRLTVTVQNRTRFATELNFQHWDLILADGTRLAGEKDHFDFGPLDALPLELWFDDDSDQGLEGAHLELNGSKYGVYLPLSIPLDAPVAAEPVLELPALVGQLFPTQPNEESVWQHEILFAEVSYNGDGYNGVERARAEFGKKLLNLVVRSSFLVGSARRNLFDERYHLNVGGTGVSTQSVVNELPDMGESVEVPIVFQIDEDVSEFDIEFDTGANSAPIWETLRVDLSEAVPVH